MKTLALISLLCASAHFLYAQQAPRPVPPSGPLLERAPDFAQWTITSKANGAPPPPDPSGAAPKPSPAGGSKTPPDPLDQQTIVVKTKPIHYEQTTTAGGKKIVRWCMADLQVTSLGPGELTVAFAGDLRGVGTMDYSKSDFSGFGWISPQNFEGIEKYSGVDCLVFRDTFKVDGKALKSDRPLSNVAYIDSQTRLPVALQLGEEMRTYQFGPTPAAMLTLPPDVDAVVTQWRKTIRQASMPVAKP